LSRSAALYGHWIWPRDDHRIRVWADELLLELAGRSVNASTDAPDRAGYLVRGLVIDTSFLCGQCAGTRSEAVEGSVAAAAVRITIPSAFDCHLRLADYVGAQRLVERCPELFDSPWLLGWKAVVRGHVWPESATDAFHEAATHFQSESAEAGGRWSSYFRALSLLAAARTDPARMVDHLQRASEALPLSSGASLAPEASQLAALLQALAAVAVAGTPAVGAVRHELLDAAGAQGENGEDPTREALTRLVAEGLEAIAVDPLGEVGVSRLANVMEALRRLPHVRDATHPIGPAINLKIHTPPLLPISTGLHNVLALVSDADVYQRLLFRVIQAWAPLHADVVQGPVRSGRNVALLLRQNGQLVLRLFRAMAGGTRMATWSDVRSEVEEIFRSPLRGLAPLAGPVRRMGTLVLNSRLAEADRSELAAWSGRLRRAFGPEAEVMDLDDYVQWIVRDRLVNDLRAALAEPAF
jgi:enamine deaminase RidA (YjgF/YER057c/UK114 family)